MIAFLIDSIQAKNDIEIYIHFQLSKGDANQGECMSNGDGTGALLRVAVGDDGAPRAYDQSTGA
eukprot:CAMPEP_0197071618 /NCGR_PEP_ID=MMETSP1384-20130603/207901_1 /TAXON_ID=29189 /ORGANISM="Ammonia sp." /LENGTH=63 /DNA_ID=CAMNT_0042510339 /DNA_START=97 /DNA_END=285 /DNA_ORIENTATION=-